MRQYLDFLTHILENGEQKPDRTGVGTLSTFGYTMRFDLQQGFPLLTTKRVHYHSVFVELLWFLKGETNIRYLNENKVTIWNEWADANGELGSVYGKQWRAWETKEGKTIDQITWLVSQIKNNPHSRRHILNAWNVGELNDMSLPPCHLLAQFYVSHKGLSCQVFQRSADAFLGVPFNIASYALLTELFAQQCDLKAHELIWAGGDCHIYLNHLQQVDLQLHRTPLPLPILTFTRKPDTLLDYKITDIHLEHYHSHPAIKAPIAI